MWSSKVIAESVMNWDVHFVVTKPNSATGIKQKSWTYWGFHKVKCDFVQCDSYRNFWEKVSKKLVGYVTTNSPKQKTVSVLAL